MTRALIGMLAVAGAAAGADAFELRCRWVTRHAGVDTPIPAEGYQFLPGETSVMLRLQFGVFADDQGDPPGGGVLGWNVGRIDGSPDPVVGSAPFRITPFNFANPFYGGTLNPLHMNNIDNTMGTQSLAWNGIPGTNDPGAPPPAVVRGINTLVSTYQISVGAGAADFDVTAAGNFIAASSWRDISSTPPAPGADGLFGTPDDTPGSITYVPVTLLPIPFSGCTAHFLAVPSPAGALLIGVGALGALRRRRHS